MIVRPLTEHWRASLLSCAALALLFMPSQNPATVPSSRMAESWWKKRHERCRTTTTQYRADVAFLGDSITEGWEEDGRAVWDREIAPLGAANFGFGGDSTNHVLWRLENGELIGMNPKVVVMMVGTCNVKRGATPEETAEGVQAIVEEIRDKLPTSKVLLLGIFPRGRSADDELWQTVASTDEILERLDDGRNVKFLDIGNAFIDDDGNLSEEMLPDAVHLSAKGYEAWAEAMMPTLQKMLRD
jgi:lysophospholipase L1-like esterase